MIIKRDVPIKSISWLSHCDSGIISFFYEPESKEELVELCKKLYHDGKSFDIIGFTSNIYYTSDYNVENVVSTRKVKKIEYNNEFIDVDCGVSVSYLARQMVEKGVSGFEGLIDLPGTVGASIFGNSSCYNCSINSMIISVEFLNENGDIVELKPNELKLEHRSSVFKRGELHGIILSARLMCRHSDCLAIKELANYYRMERKNTQPGPANNLGSIFRCQGTPTLYYYAMKIISFLSCKIFLAFICNKKKAKDYEKKVFFSLIGAKDLLPYVYDWNRYIWRDKSAHQLFEKYLKIHQRLFSGNELEIVIK